MTNIQLELENKELRDKLKSKENVEQQLAEAYEFLRKDANKILELNEKIKELKSTSKDKTYLESALSIEKEARIEAEKSRDELKNLTNKLIENMPILCEQINDVLEEMSNIRKELDYRGHQLENIMAMIKQLNK